MRVTAAERRTVGVVGLGAMGAPIAARLRASGHDVVGFDVDAGRCAAAAAKGVAVAASPAEVGRAATRFVLVLVRTAAQAEDAVAGRGGLADAGHRRTVVLMSTVGVRAARTLERRAREAGLDLLDAPVSGGTAGAADGTLTVMLSGASAVRERARPLLDVLAGPVVVAGDRPGDGQAMKLVHQQVMCVTVAGAAEGLRLAGALGLDREAVLRALRHGTARSWAVEHWPEVAAFWQSYTPDGSLELLRKDLSYALAEAADAGLELPVSGSTAIALPQAWPRAAGG